MWVPLKTLPGNVPAPIEPGWRCESEPWVSGPRRKWWRLIVPEKPRPLLTPMASTTSPTANSVASSVWPTSILGHVGDAELARVAHPRQVRQLAQARLGEVAGRAGAELHGGVPVARLGPHGGHRVGFDAHDGDGHERAVRGEDLGHADLAADQTDAHGRITS